MKHSLTAGPMGPILLQDTVMLEKVTHFDREKIPPRNVHAHGTGVHGHFVSTNDVSKYTCASLFSKGKKTPLFARFSGIFTEVGDPETARDPRGFAMKFYTEQGNWDLLAINTPVFNVRDVKLGPDAVHAFKRDPRTGMWNSEQLWDFVVNHPESLHQTLMIFSDRVGTPMSFRYMHAYGCNTFSFYNEHKERFWVKFHVNSDLGARGFNLSEAKMLAGEDSNILSRDLHDAIAAGNFPTWTLACQIMPEKDGFVFPWTFDCTKIWKHEDYPLIELGKITLDKNPTDYHAEVEQVAFSPASVVPGISYSPDRLLQGRIFLYDDTQYHRLGSNYKQIPVNLPHVVPTTNYVGGHHQMEIRDKYPHYYPSEYGGPKPSPQYAEPAIPATGPAGFYDHPSEGTDDDYYSQAREFLNVMTDSDYRHLVNNLASSLEKVSDTVTEKAIHHLRQISTKLGDQVQSKRKDITAGTVGFTEGEKLLKKIREGLKNDTFVKDPVE
jgi:catalase